MIYIHRLKDLNPKSAEIESTPIIREIKRRVILPASEENLRGHFSEFFAEEEDKKLIINTIELVDPVTFEIKDIFDKNDPLYEPVNLKRAVDVLREVPEALKNNLKYIEDMEVWESELIKEFTVIINALPRLRTFEEKKEYNDKIGALFEKLLRNETFLFRFTDIINEAHVEHIDALIKSMEDGYLFHITLEEELRKEKFNNIKNRIPKSEVQKNDNLIQEIKEIKKGVDAAYKSNMKMVNLAIILYSYVRMLS